jgi:hypothetical protein
VARILTNVPPASWRPRLPHWSEPKEGRHGFVA